MNIFKNVRTEVPKGCCILVKGRIGLDDKITSLKNLVLYKFNSCIPQIGALIFLSLFASQISFGQRSNYLDF
jgi:hypothetical protein